MNHAAHAGQTALPATTPLREKLPNIFVCPGEVFDEVIAAPPAMVNWRLPTLFVCLAGIVLLMTTAAGQGDALTQLASAATLSQEQKEMFAGAWPLVSALSVCLAAFVGTLWSAFVLWFIGRVFLQVRFSYLKTLEIVGLTGIILVLGTIVTGLLVAVTGDPAARPSLALLVGKSSSSRVHQLLDTLNLFHLWSTTVLAVGLSRLSGVSFKEAAFWVVGYWLCARIALIILA